MVWRRLVLRIGFRFVEAPTVGSLARGLGEFNVRRPADRLPKALSVQVAAPGNAARGYRSHVDARSSDLHRSGDGATSFVLRPCLRLGSDVYVIEILEPLSDWAWLKRG